jgi:hypothetical protein
MTPGPVIKSKSPNLNSTTSLEALLKASFKKSPSINRTSRNRLLGSTTVPSNLPVIDLCSKTTTGHFTYKKSPLN